MSDPDALKARRFETVRLSGNWSCMCAISGGSSMSSRTVMS